uniref:Uncharacterized protein n=1 Tax=Romanomermis culicivorax TaxID=13658 RepID=A0A915KCN8_ROMCU
MLDKFFRYDKNLLEISDNSVLIRYSGISFDSDTICAEEQKSLIGSEGSPRGSLGQLDVIYG